jgi:hypothetical protein
MGILNLWGGATFEGIDKFDKEVETPKRGVELGTYWIMFVFPFVSVFSWWRAAT